MKTVKEASVVRSILHNKRIAPKGCVYFVARKTVAWSADQNRTFCTYVLVNTKEATPAMEESLKNKLLAKLEADIAKLSLSSASVRKLK